MKRTLLSALPDAVPAELASLLRGAPVYDSSCSPEARVYFIDRDGGYYLKSSPSGTLRTEADMTAYFHRLGLGAEVLCYTDDGKSDWLLCARVRGEDATHAGYLSEPERLCDLLAASLRMLHEMPAEGCPVPDRMRTYALTVNEGYREGRFDPHLFEHTYPFPSADEAYAVWQAGKTALCGRVLLHGDYCLPNVMLDGWRLSGFIDLGNGGIGDRHIDLLWGTWTLQYNLGTDRYFGRFLDAYGRDLADEALLRTVAAAEVFG